MRYAIKYALAATFIAGAAAGAHRHGHQHLHGRREASPVEKRDGQPDSDVVVEYVAGPTETVYEWDGQIVAAEKAVKGIDAGDFIVVGESVPTVKPPPPPPKPTTTSKPNLGAQFIEKPTTTSKPPPKPTQEKEKPKPKPSNNGGSGDVNTPFESGKVKCSEFPSAYGAVPLDWLKTGGWSGIQRLPSYSKGASLVGKIDTAIAGESCTKGAMCSYACPPGYEKTQWPAKQGDTKESIGGLYCNDEGYLELTRKETNKLCERGVGGVFIQNDLDDVVATCRTDYPGTENMVIPAEAGPGEEIELCNPDQSTYQWDGKLTSAQYYVNPKGYSKEEACTWSTKSAGLGNFAPMNIGTGRAPNGQTYISVFPNVPTTNEKLKFNIEIGGDVSSKCLYKNGQFSGPGATSTGCTTGLKSGGKAIIRYF